VSTPRSPPREGGPGCARWFSNDHRSRRRPSEGTVWSLVREKLPPRGGPEPRVRPALQGPDDAGRVPDGDDVCREVPRDHSARADAEVVPVVAVERRTDNTVGPERRKELLEDPPPSRGFIVRAAVVRLQQSHGPAAVPSELRVVGEVGSPGEHPLTLCPGIVAHSISLHHGELCEPPIGGPSGQHSARSL